MGARLRGVTGRYQGAPVPRRSTEAAGWSREDVVIAMAGERFDELVRDALDSLPPRLARLVDNCVVLVEEDPPADEPDLLGLYEGTPLTERDSGYTMVTPDRITIFRSGVLGVCDSEDDVVEEVRITVVHEIAHHFGIDDDRLHELGYG